MSNLVHTDSTGVVDHLRAHYAAAGSTYSIDYGPGDMDIDRRVFGQSQVELETAEIGDDRRGLEAKYAGQAHCISRSPAYWTPYSAIHRAVHHLRPVKGDTLYDLGSGYGALPIYAGAVTEARCIGIELTAHRVEAARRAIGRLGLSNVEMLEGSVNDHDFSDGNAFYMFAPFDFPTFFSVLDKIGQIAETRPIRLVMRRISGDWLNEGWLGNATKTVIKGSSGDMLLVEAGPNT